MGQIHFIVMYEKNEERQYL